MSTEDTPRLKTTRQLAYRFNVSESTIKKWKNSGMPHLTVGRVLRFELDKVVDWVAHRGTPQEPVASPSIDSQPRRRRRRGAHHPQG